MADTIKKRNYLKIMVLIILILCVVIVVFQVFKKDKIVLVDETGQMIVGKSGKFLKTPEVEEEAG